MSYPFETSRQPSQTATKPVTPDTLPVILYHDLRVITTDLLAQLYGTEAIRIQQNYNSNKDRFVEGKHFFKLEGEELRRFKDFHCLVKNESVEIAPRTRNLTLWTERGAARHAKIIDTDPAWDVFERLEEAYFRPREARAAFGTGPQGELFDVPPDLGAVARVFGQGLRLAKLGGLDADQARRIADRETFKRLGVSPLAILNVDAPANQPSYTVENVPGSAVLCASKLLQQHGGHWTVKEFHRAMEQIGYIERRIVELPDKPAIRYPVLIGEGLQYGDNVRYETKYLTTNPVYYVDRFPTLMEIVEPAIEDQNRREAEALSVSTDKMSQRQRRIYKDSGLGEQRKAERKAEKREDLRERKRQEVIEGAQAGQPWRGIRDASNLRKYFDAEELTELRALYTQHLKPARDSRGRFVSPQQALPASLQPVDREAANNPDWLEPKDLIDPAARAEYKARNQYQPVSREQAREFLIEEAQKFLAVGDDWDTFCYMRGRIFPMAFNDAEVLSLRQAYDRAFPTGDPLDWSGAV